jgi:hypothetical protein
VHNLVYDAHIAFLPQIDKNEHAQAQPMP